jgi:hypothetical protein
LLADGSIFVGGSYDYSSSPLGGTALVAHYSANGILDQGFGSGGRILLGNGFNSGNMVSLNAIAIRPNGNVVLAGSLNKNVMVGQLAGYVPDVVAMTSSSDSLVLRQSADHQHIDWTMGTLSGQIPINDPAGLTLNGVGGNDVILLDYSRGNPLPNNMHLNGTFTINGLNGAEALAWTNIDIGSSTVFVSYDPAANSAALIQQSLKNGFNAGGWNGPASETTGVITSSVAASGPSGKYGVGFADSADGIVTGLAANTIEIRYTLMGDVNLDQKVDAVDAVTMARNWNGTGTPTWDHGDFDYDATVSMADATLLQKNWNASMPALTAPAIVAAASLMPTGSVVSPPAVLSTPPVSPTAPAKGTDPVKGSKKKTSDAWGISAVEARPHVDPAPRRLTTDDDDNDAKHGKGRDRR